MDNTKEKEIILRIIREKQTLDLKDQVAFIKHVFRRHGWSAESTEKEPLIQQLIAEGVITVVIPPVTINPAEPGLDISQIHRSDATRLMYAKIVESPYQ